MTRSTTDTVWWQKPFRLFQTNLREIDAGLDVEQVLDFIQDYGADVWMLSVAGIIANHPSDLAAQTPNPALASRPSQDLVGDAVAAAGRRGIRVIGRTDFSKVDHRRAEQHPDWCFVDQRGRQQVYNGLVSVCPSGDYYQEQLFDVLAELLDRYPLSGFFLNWMSFNEVDYSRTYRGVCHCHGCRAAFADYAPGTPLPAGPQDDGYLVWKRFTAETLDKLTARIRQHVRSLAPDAALLLGDRADLHYHEANNAVGRPLWHHRTSEAVSAARTRAPEMPVVVNSTGFVDMPYRMAGEDPQHFAQYLIQAIAGGASPGTYVMGTPAEFSYPNLDTGRDIFGFHRDHLSVYTGLRSDAEVLLVRPTNSPSSVARSEFEGIYLALTERHLPFDVIDVEKLDAPVRHRVVVLADVGPLTESTAAVLSDFVAAGGALLTTGGSALADGRSQLVGSPVAQQLASYTDDDSLFSLHLRVDDGPILVTGAFHLVAPHPEAETAYPSTGRAPYGPPEKCYGHVDPGHPGCLRRTVGSGRMTVLPWTVGHVYRQVGLSVARDIIADAVITLGATPIESSLPEQVQVISGRSDAGRVLHLLNRSGDVVQGFRAPLPIAGSSLILAEHFGEPPKVRALRAGVDCATRITDSGIQVELPTIERFEVLLITTTADDQPEQG